MTKTVTEIDCPKGFEAKDDYGSHRPALWVALNNVDGNVSEIGCGFGSTKLLDAYCMIHGRKFFSFENDEDWSNKIYVNHGMRVIFPKGYPSGLLPHNPDILFVDSKPGEQRKEIIKDHADSVKVIIVHDTESGAEYVYHMNDVLNSFKYRLDYTPIGKPATTIVSNFVNVCEWI